MMNIPPSETKRLSLWEYEAMLFNWNKAHSTGDVEPADPVKTQKLIDRINSDPKLFEGTGKRGEPMRAGFTPAEPLNLQAI